MGGALKWHEDRPFKALRRLFFGGEPFQCSTEFAVAREFAKIILVRARLDIRNLAIATVAGRTYVDIH